MPARLPYANASIEEMRALWTDEINQQSTANVVFNFPDGKHLFARSSILAKRSIKFKSQFESAKQNTSVDKYPLSDMPHIAYNVDIVHFRYEIFLAMLQY